jgi:hypothetical protein
VLKQLKEHKVLTVTLCLLSVLIVVAVIMMPFRGPAPIKKADQEQLPAPVTAGPPLLNKTNLVGSIWEVSVSGLPVNVALEPDGKATASSDNMVVRQLAKAQIGSETLSGTWDVDGAKLTVKTKIKNKEQTTDLVIRGNQVYSKDDVPIVRKK